MFRSLHSSASPPINEVPDLLAEHLSPQNLEKLRIYLQDELVRAHSNLPKDPKNAFSVLKRAEQDSRAAADEIAAAMRKENIILKQRLERSDKMCVELSRQLDRSSKRAREALALRPQVNEVEKQVEKPRARRRPDAGQPTGRWKLNSRAMRQEAIAEGLRAASPQQLITDSRDPPHSANAISGGVESRVLVARSTSSSSDPLLETQEFHPTTPTVHVKTIPKEESPGPGPGAPQRSQSSGDLLPKYQDALDKQMEVVDGEPSCEYPNADQREQNPRSGSMPPFLSSKGNAASAVAVTVAPPKVWKRLKGAEPGRLFSKHVRERVDFLFEGDAVGKRGR